KAGRPTGAAGHGRDRAVRRNAGEVAAPLAVARALRRRWEDVLAVYRVAGTRAGAAEVRGPLSVYGWIPSAGLRADRHGYRRRRCHQRRFRLAPRHAAEAGRGT